MKPGRRMLWLAVNSAAVKTRVLDSETGGDRRDKMRDAMRTDFYFTHGHKYHHF
jgi:hypothetical protein